MSMSKAPRSKQQSGDMTLVIETLRRPEWGTRSGIRGERCLSGRIVRKGWAMGSGVNPTHTYEQANMLRRGKETCNERSAARSSLLTPHWVLTRIMLELPVLILECGMCILKEAV